MFISKREKFLTIKNDPQFADWHEWSKQPRVRKFLDIFASNCGFVGPISEPLRPMFKPKRTVSFGFELENDRLVICQEIRHPGGLLVNKIELEPTLTPEEVEEKFKSAVADLSRIEVGSMKKDHLLDADFVRECVVAAYENTAWQQIRDNIEEKKQELDIIAAAEINQEADKLLQDDGFSLAAYR